MPVDNMESAIDFYESIGFTVEPWDKQYAWVKHCGKEWLHLRLVDSVENNQASAYLHVDDAAAWHRAMLEASGGRAQLGDYETKPWDKLEYSFTDPAGNLIRIGSPT